MSQRNSEYERKPNDLYETPRWVTEVLIDNLPRIAGKVWEPAAGNGSMARVLAENFDVITSDVECPSPWPKELPCPTVHDFFQEPITAAEAIITNPPFTKGVCLPFVERALQLTEKHRGVVAMLQRVDWDSAKTRAHLFADHPAFAKKVVLRKRITWFVEANGKPRSSPSENHSWFIWDWLHAGPPTIAYAP